MLIHKRMESSSVNGPGNRAVVWFQGCSLACKGCWNPDTHAFPPANEVHVDEIAEWILGLEGIEGVTFSGGEPMQQAPSLFLIMDIVRQKSPELSFGMYTGYSMKELEEGRFKWKSMYDAEWKAGDRELWAKVKSYLDFAVMGRYNELLRTQDNNKPLIGSTNQQVMFFTDRYKEADLEGGYEVTVSADGELTQITGFPPLEAL